MAMLRRFWIMGAQATLPRRVSRHERSGEFEGPDGTGAA
jgi:hypothetical protein